VGFLEPGKPEGRVAKPTRSQQLSQESGADMAWMLPMATAGDLTTLKEHKRQGAWRTERANRAWRGSQGTVQKFAQQLVQGGPRSQPVGHSRGESSRSLP